MKRYHRITAKEDGSEQWVTMLDPEKEEYCFVAIKKIKDRYKPIVLALRPDASGKLYWDYLKLGRSVKLKTSAEHRGRQFAIHYKCNFERDQLFYPENVVPPSITPSLETLGKITLLWKTR